MNLFFLLLSSLSIVSSFVVVSSLPIQSNWVRSPNPAVGSTQIKLTIALPQRNVDQLEKLFWAVSDPSSPSYQQFLSKDEIGSIVATEPKIVTEVTNWLKSSGVGEEEIVILSDAIQFRTNVGIATNLFNADFFKFTSKATGKEVVRIEGSYQIIDQNIKNHIVLIEGLNNFPGEHLRAGRHSLKPQVNGAVGDAGNAWDVYLPQLVLDLYGVPNVTETPLPAPVSHCVAQWGEYYDETDLQSYDTNTYLSYTPLDPNHIIGSNDPGLPGSESQMDIELISGVNPAGVNWFIVNDNSQWMYSFGLQLANMADIPHIISMSYGLDEQETTITDSNSSTIQDYINRVNVEFMKIGLRGVTLLAASGDSGANGRSDSDCSQPYLNALFPASSPYITSVGATQITNPVYDLPTPPHAMCSPFNIFGYKCVSGGEEVAVSLDFASFTSGGGFANFSTQPAYQKDAVAAYLNSGVALPPTSYYSPQGRAVPDVAAIGTKGYEVIGWSADNQAGGTSMATPTFAGVMSVLNSYQVHLTGKPLGFLNPLLYKMAAEDPTTFTDITSGDNIFPEGGGSSSCKGWLAGKGWDPVTGLGSPVFKNMLKYIQKQAAARKRVVQM